MSSRNVVLRDREETRQARFRREQVVAAGIQRAFDSLIADSQQLALRVQQEVELRRQRQHARTCLQRQQASIERMTRGLGLFQIATPALDRALRSLRPEQHVSMSS